MLNTKQNQPLNSESQEQNLFDVREVGRVASVREFILNVEGLPSCMNGQRVELATGDPGMVMGFNEKSVLVLVLGNKVRVRAGQEVFSRGEPFLVPVGDGFLGRVISPLGEPMDGGERIRPDAHNPAFYEAPGVMERIPVKEALETGILIVDSGFPIAKGQRQLIIGDQMTGKSTILTDTILNQKGKNVICIYCAIGQSQSSFRKVLRVLKDSGALDYTIVIGGIASAPLGEQYLAPYTACALAEYFQSKGKDVFVGFDDLSKHAWAYRQLSLLLERPPGREAYPGDIFYVHSQLLERAGKFLPELGGGSITFFPVVATIQGDITGYVQTNLISITDGQLYLSTALFQHGFKPAIDFGLSVSRIGNKAMSPAMKEMSGKLRLEYLQYQELKRMTTLKAELSADSEAKLKRGELVTKMMIQFKGQPLCLVEELLYLFGIRSGLLDKHPDFWVQFKGEIYEWTRAYYPKIVKEIEEKQALSAELKEEMLKALKEYLQKSGVTLSP